LNRINPKVKPFLFENERSVFHGQSCPAIACSPRYAALHCGLPALSGLFNKGGCSDATKPQIELPVLPAKPGSTMAAFHKK